MQLGAVFHVCNGYNPAAEAGELHKFLLNCFQPFLPFGKSELSVLLNLRNLDPQTTDFLP